MTPAKLRVMLRWMHIVLGLVILCYVYSPFGENQVFRSAVQFVVIPVLTLTGIGIWQFKAVNKLFKIEGK